MKRCPQCLFIYPESDQRCDFDNTPLVAVADSEIDAATKPRRRNLLFVLIPVVVVMLLGIFVFYKTSRRTAPDVPLVVTEAAPLPQAPSPTPLPSPSVSPSPSPKPSPARTATEHTTSSLNPISTSTEAATKRKPVILLTDGGKIEADEVWRTRDGIWYRRNGLVTLVKHARVRSIVNQ